MGGTFFDEQPEHNIRCDTVAAAKVFGSGVPIAALGLDVTMIPFIREKDLLRPEGRPSPSPAWRPSKPAAGGCSVMPLKIIRMMSSRLWGWSVSIFFVSERAACRCN